MDWIFGENVNKIAIFYLVPEFAEIAMTIIFGIVLFAQPFFQFIYGFTVFQMENLPQNEWFCIFDLLFAQIVALFATLRDPKSDLCLTKYIFRIILFAQPFMDL